jgi:hypothetical protein
MHATIGSSGTVYHHNGDFSGDVYFTPASPTGMLPLDTVAIPFEDILDLVGKYYQGEAISKIEQMTGKEYLDSVT